MRHRGAPELYPGEHRSNLNNSVDAKMHHNDYMNDHSNRRASVDYDLDKKNSSRKNTIDYPNSGAVVEGM